MKWGGLVIQEHAGRDKGADDGASISSVCHIAERTAREAAGKRAGIGAPIRIAFVEN